MDGFEPSTLSAPSTAASFPISPGGGRGQALDNLAHIALDAILFIIDEPAPLRIPSLNLEMDEGGDNPPLSKLTPDPYRQ
jgi:hypothetical protein